MGRRVLLVESDEDLRGVLAEVLELSGYAVRAVRDPAEARAALRAEPPELVTLDLGFRDAALPFAVELRRSPRRVALVCLSTSRGARYPADLLVLPKPAAADELLAAIGRALPP